MLREDRRHRLICLLQSAVRGRNEETVGQIRQSSHFEPSLSKPLIPELLSKTTTQGREQRGGFL